MSFIRFRVLLSTIVQISGECHKYIILMMSILLEMQLISLHNTLCNVLVTFVTCL